MTAYNIKSIKEDFKAKGVFYTPPELANLLKSYVPDDVEEVYDPACGDGALLSVFDDSVKKYGQEITDHQLDVAKKHLINFDGVCGDTLTNPAFMGRKFECIVANPPFSIKWNPPLLNGMFTDARFQHAPALPPKSKADYAFLLHILHYLANDGIAVVLNFPGVLYRGNSEGKIRKWMVEQNYIDKVVRIEGGRFVDTKIETALIVFRKNKATTDIEFVDSEYNLSRTVELDEVRQSGYTLSVSTYVQKEEEREKIDIDKVNIGVREAAICQLRTSLEMERFMSTLSGLDFNQFVQDIQKVLDEYKH